MEIVGCLGGIALGVVGGLGTHGFPQGWWGDRPEDSPLAFALMVIGILPVLIFNIPRRQGESIARRLCRVYGAVVIVGAIVAGLTLGWLALYSIVEAMSLRSIGLVAVALLVVILIRQGREQHC